MDTVRSGAIAGPLRPLRCHSQVCPLKKNYIFQTNFDGLVSFLSITFNPQMKIICLGTFLVHGRCLLKCLVWLKNCEFLVFVNNFAKIKLFWEMAIFTEVSGLEKK